MNLDILRAGIMVASGLAVPVLSVLAFRAWDTTLKKELPRWRAVPGLLSVCLTFSLWLLVVLQTTVLLIGLRIRSVQVILDSTTPYSLLAGMGLSLLLKGSPRIHAFVASLSMGLFLFTSGVP